MNFSGFAGLGGEEIRNRQTENYKELFDFAAECHSLAMDSASEIPATIEKNKVPVCLLFARALTHFQAAVSLAQGGMAIEALIICRSLVETAFVLAALAEGGVSPSDLVQHDLACRRKIAKAFLKPNDYENLEQFKERLDNFVSENEDSKEISIFSFAEKANASALYDGLYRHLSHFAAHPSLSATEPYLVVDEDKNGGRFDPALHYAPKALLGACAGISVCIFSIEKIFPGTPALKTRGAKLFDQYELLYVRYNPWK